MPTKTKMKKHLGTISSTDRRFNPLSKDQLKICMSGKAAKTESKHLKEYLIISHTVKAKYFFRIKRLHVKKDQFIAIE